METSAPISLYLGLEEGKAAKIEVVARAALAWAEAVKELAYVIDPSIEIEIELISGTEGSLSLNAVIKAVSKLRGKRPTSLATLIVLSLSWFVVQSASYTLEKLLDYLTGDKAPAIVREMTKEEIEALAHEVMLGLARKIAEDQKRRIFLEIEKDENITGIGSTQEPNTKPDVIVPRSEFKERSSEPLPPPEFEPTRRSRYEMMTVVLISPILKNADRSWRFQMGSMPEFGAAMKDQAFLETVLTGQTALPLRAGLEMDIQLETKEERIDGLWTVKERSVARVFDIRIASGSQQLRLTPREPDSENAGDGEEKK
jgi:hypothetical protein